MHSSARDKEDKTRKAGAPRARSACELTRLTFMPRRHHPHSNHLSHTTQMQTDSDKETEGCACPEGVRLARAWDWGGRRGAEKGETAAATAARQSSTVSPNMRAVLLLSALSALFSGAGSGLIPSSMHAVAYLRGGEFRTLGSAHAVLQRRHARQVHVRPCALLVPARCLFHTGDLLPRPCQPFLLSLRRCPLHRPLQDAVSMPLLTGHEPLLTGHEIRVRASVWRGVCRLHGMRG